jgi:hypothetical protein
MDIIVKLPEDIQRYIYEFDPTYKIKYSYCMVSINMMSNQLLYYKWMTICKIKKYKPLYDIYLYMSEYSQKMSFENRRKNVKILYNVNHMKCDNPELCDDITQHNNNVIRRKNYVRILS